MPDCSKSTKAVRGRFKCQGAVGTGDGWISSRRRRAFLWDDRKTKESEGGSERLHLAAWPLAQPIYVSLSPQLLPWSSTVLPRQTNGRPEIVSTTPSKFGGFSGSARAKSSSSWVSPRAGGWSSNENFAPDRFAPLSSAPDRSAPAKMAFDRFAFLKSAQHSLAPDRRDSDKSASIRLLNSRFTRIRRAQQSFAR